MPRNARSGVRLAVASAASVAALAGVAAHDGAAAGAGSCAVVWKAVSSPLLTGRELQAVAADAPDDAWAVGGQSIFEKGPRRAALIEHWDGTRWAVASSPPVAGVFVSVATAARDDVWAVGTRGTYEPGDFGGAGGKSAVALAERWDGARWHSVGFPGLRALSAVTAISERDVWMVGADSTHAAVILHWDGVRWTRTRIPDAELLSLAALSSTDVWAVGDISGSRFLEMHWDGRRWSSYSQLAPNGGYGPDENPQLTSVGAAGTRDVWAAGDAGNSGDPAWPDTVLFHCDGTRWRKAPAPHNSWVYALTLRVPGDLWLAGGFGNGDAYAPPLLVRRVGLAWRSTSIAGQVNGLSTDRTAGLWAVGFVGSRFDSSLQFPHRTRPLIARAHCA